MLKAFLPLLFQKPLLKSESREHIKYILEQKNRIGENAESYQNWSQSVKLYIQTRQKSVKTKKQSNRTASCRLTLQGQVKKAP